MDAVLDRGRIDGQLFRQFGGVLVRDIEGDLHVAAFDQRALGRCRGHLAQDDAAHCGHRAADPGVVAFINDLLALVPADHLEGAGADGVLVQVLGGPGIVSRGVGPGQGGVDDERHRNGEVGQRQLGRAVEFHHEGRVIHCLELFGPVEAAGLHLRGRKAADGDGAVKGPFHICRSDLGAVLEGGVGLDLEGERQAVIRDGPAFGQFRLDRGIIVGQAAAGGLLGAEGHKPVIAVDRDLIAGPVGAGAMQVEAVDGLAADDDQRVAAGSMCG